MARIREKLIKRIRNSDHTVTEISNIIGLKQPRLSEFIHGKRKKISDVQMISLCVILNCSHKDILYSEDYHLYKKRY